MLTKQLSFRRILIVGFQFSIYVDPFNTAIAGVQTNVISTALDCDDWLLLAYCVEKLLKKQS